MESAVLFLLLCLWLSLVSQGHSETSVPQWDDIGTGAVVPPQLPILWDELRGLKELVLSLKAEEVQWRQALRHMESQLRDREVEAEQQRRSLDGLEAHRNLLTDLDSHLRRKVDELEEQSKALQTRLNASERSVEDLRKKNTALAAELPFLQTRLRACESTVEQLRRKNAVLASRLCHTETLVEDLRIQISASNTSSQELNTNSEVLHSQLNSSETEQLSLILAQFSVMESRLSQINTTTTALKVRLRSSETHLEQLQLENTAQSAQLTTMESRLTHNSNNTTDLEVRLSVSEKQLEHLQMENTAQFSVMESRLSQINTTTTALKVRLRSSETHLEQLQLENTAQSAQLTMMESRLTHNSNNTTDLEVRLSVSEKQLEHLQMENTDLVVRLNVGEKQLEHLQVANTDELKVAFSAGLTDSGSVGPFDQETTLVFSKTISNVGGAYDQAAGVFTAPFRGVYFFCFTAADYLKGYMGLYLYRNDQPIVFNLDLNDHGGYASTSNGVALQLEEGDRVRLSLPASYRLYDDSRNFSVFSGFLLFPL